MLRKSDAILLALMLWQNFESILVNLVCQMYVSVKINHITSDSILFYSILQPSILWCFNAITTNEGQAKEAETNREIGTDTQKDRERYGDWLLYIQNEIESFRK